MVGNLDSDSSHESFSLYTELARSHKWLDKVLIDCLIDFKKYLFMKNVFLIGTILYVAYGNTINVKILIYQY